MKLGKSTIILIALAVVGMMFVSGMPMLSLFGPSTDTVEKVITPTDWSFASFTGHAELDDTEYATGWKPDSIADSEEMNVAQDLAPRNSYIDFSVKGDLFSIKAMQLERYWYVWLVNGEIEHTSPTHTGGDVVDVVKKITSASKRLMLQESGFNVKGAVSGIVTVELRADVSFYLQDATHPFGETDRQTNVLLSSDSAHLKSGACKLGMADMYNKQVETGDDALIYIETGFTHGQGWDVKVTPPAHTGLQRYIWKHIGDDDKRTHALPIPENWFKFGDVNGNEVLIELYSPVFKESETEFFTIDDKDLAPIMDEAILSSTNVYAGERVTLSFTGSSNEKTDLPIDHFLVYVYYGSGLHQPGEEGHAIYGQRVTAIDNGDGTYSASVDFQTSVTNNVVAHVTAKDTGGRASNTKYAQLSSTVKGDDPPYDPPYGPPPIDDFSSMWNIYAIASLIIGLLGALAYFIYAPNDPLSAMVGIPKIVPTLIIAVITIIITYYLTKDPTLATGFVWQT